MSGTEAVDCPICLGDYASFWGREYKGSILTRCRQCGLRYVNPRRNEAVNLQVYEAGYFDSYRRAEADAEEAARLLEGHRLSLRRALAHSKTQTPSILDIGCGTGGFLKAARLKGCTDLTGTDISPANVEALAREGIRVRIGEVYDLAPEGKTYGLVSAHHVLEHVRDPNRFLQGIRPLMRSDGVLHFILPNEGSLSSRVKSFLSRRGLKAQPFKHLSPGHHLYFYEGVTLEKLLVKNGFKVLYRGTRAAVKKRSAADRWAHGLLDLLKLNSYLECVAAPA